jgi:6-phosphofructokinase 1
MSCLLNWMRGGKTNKKSSLIVVAEGSKLGSAMELAKKVSERNNYFDIKVTILGHLQRGGSPTYFRPGISQPDGCGCN